MFVHVWWHCRFRIRKASSSRKPSVSRQYSKIRENKAQTSQVSFAEYGEASFALSFHALDNGGYHLFFLEVETNNSSCKLMTGISLRCYMVKENNPHWIGQLYQCMIIHSGIQIFFFLKKMFWTWDSSLTLLPILSSSLPMEYNNSTSDST